MSKYKVCYHCEVNKAEYVSIDPKGREPNRKVCGNCADHERKEGRTVNRIGSSY